MYLLVTINPDGSIGSNSASYRYDDLVSFEEFPRIGIAG